ncbi:MAG TPA: threonine ammonia-lyase [Bryobacteraceae bacterium]|nr:threonine ammonia-lyase [Bryobacteraceae bacterium]
MPVTMEDILAARARIAGAVTCTPCPQSIPLSEVCGFSVYCKMEYRQITGSFKERGARNALVTLSGSRGVIAASAGNHALGLSYHGKLLGIPVTVVMPKQSPLIKSETCRRYGATVILHGESLAEAKTLAEEMAAGEGLQYINGYDDAAIIAGQGTIGLELMEQVPHADAIIVPVGGGGLMAGIALAVKQTNPSVSIIGVEPENAASFSRSLEAGHVLDAEIGPTLADGLAVARVGERAFEIAKERIDSLVTVTEDEIALAILRLVELEKGVVEGAGAATLAACLSGRLDSLKGKHVVLILAGGNIDPMILSRVVERGLVTDGRLCRFTAVISDRPGGLAQLASLIAATGASIKEVLHDRAFSGPNVMAVNVHCTIETRDRNHRSEFFDRMREAKVRVLNRDIYD